MFNNDDPNENNNEERRQNTQPQQNRNNVDPHQELEDLLNLDVPMYDSMETVNQRRQQSMLNWDDFSSCPRPDFLDGTSFDAFTTSANESSYTREPRIEPPPNVVANPRDPNDNPIECSSKVEELTIEPQPQEANSNIPDDNIAEDNNEKETRNEPEIETRNEPEKETRNEPEKETRNEPEPEPEPEPAQEPMPDAKFWNVLSKFQSGIKPDLRRIARTSRESTIVQRNSFVTMAVRDPTAYAFIKPRGQITVSTQSEEDSKKATRKFAGIVKKFHRDLKIKGNKIIDVLASYELPFAIRFHEFRRAYLPHISYEPELFPGLKYRVEEESAVFSIFPNGRLTVVAPTTGNVHAAFKIIYPNLLKFKRNRTEQEIAQMQKRKKTANAKGNDGAEPDRAEPNGAEPNGAEPDGAEPVGAQ